MHLENYPSQNLPTGFTDEPINFVSTFCFTSIAAYPMLMGIEIRRILGVPAFRRKSGTQFAVNAVLCILLAKLFSDFESLVF